MYAIDSLVSTCLTEIPPPSGPVLIYGAGNKGRELASLIKSHASVIGFADRNVSHSSIDDHPVYSLEDWAKSTDLSGLTVLVGIHNHRVPMAPLLANIAAKGAKRIINPVQLHASMPDLADAYWLTAPHKLLSHVEELQDLQALFHDDISLDVLHRVLQFRLTGNYECLPEARHTDQYMPYDLPRWQEPMRLMDCGAYNGDTVQSMRRQGYHFEQLLCFEPDPANYAQLCSVVKNAGNGFALPCGVSDQTSLSHFSASGTGASNLSGGGELLVQCVSIDDVAPGFAPTLIKMDVEGAEPLALAGAWQTITRHRPALALSIYHQYDHLWRIPLLVASWRLDYDFHLRMHGNSSFDLVLYAVPRK